MRRLLIAFVLVPVLFMGPAFGVLTKTTSVELIDAWTQVNRLTSSAGSTLDTSDSYSTIIYVEMALNTNFADDTFGPISVVLEVSYGDDEWVEVTRVWHSYDTVGSTTVNDASANAGDTTITLTSAAAGNYGTIGHKWFIQDGTLANSETVRTLSASGDTITLCQDLMRSHANGVAVHDSVEEWVFLVPMSAAKARVGVYNYDGDADVVYTARASKVTAL